MDYSKKTKSELITLCKERKLKGYSTKNKAELVIFLEGSQTKEKEKDDKIYRLNYIGSKYQLLDWLSEQMLEKTGWVSFEKKRIADLFSGTGIVSYYFRTKKSSVHSNDAELYSAIISHAFTRSCFTEVCKSFLQEINQELVDKKHVTTFGYITTHYSPHGEKRRMFFTIENAQRIDYIRQRIEDSKARFTEDEYKFILASLLLSADAVSNVPAVYGCFLKNFKEKAKKILDYKPIHTYEQKPNVFSKTTNSDICKKEFLKSVKADLVYLDPPYNERQYSKNYFPLNMISMTSEEQAAEKPLKGKTGIPESCFISPFCKSEEVVTKAFETLFSTLKTEWIFLSYNSESIVPKQKMLDLMNKYGQASVIEKPYKRFKSFQYNKDKDIQEYLFCLRKA